MKRTLFSTLSLLAIAGFAQAAIAGEAVLPDRLELGHNGQGNPCTATRLWNDAASTDAFAESFSFTCRGATGNRILGVARRLKADDAARIDAGLDCGLAAQGAVAALGMVSSRRCFDRMLGLETVETRIVRSNRLLSVSAIGMAQGPAEEALRLLARSESPGADRGRTIKPDVDVSALAAPPAGVASSSAASDGETALRQGLALVQQGLHMEGSRVLNDALSRLPEDAPPATRTELLLVAGLADSNMRFFDSAESYFQRADAMIAANPGMPGAEVLARKRRTYAALDKLNRRDFVTAIGALDRIATQSAEAGQPLLDSTIVRALNQSPKADKDSEVGIVATADVASLSQLVIDAQSAWARSVALLAQNQPSASAAALDVADRNFAVIRNEKVNQQQVRWLDARIERQRARLLLRAGNRDGALAALDKAVASLKRAEADGAVGPSLAETQLERAGVMARSGGSPEVLLTQFEDAVDSLIASDSAGTVLPPSIEQYLDLLVADARTNPGGKSPERFFRALQAVSSPAIARQFVQLQSVVTADPLLAAKVQDQQDVEREITRLRFEIASATSTDAKAASVLEARKTALESQLVGIEGDLGANKAFGAVNDSTATIAELRSVLNPGEAYFRLTKVRNYAFGILIDSQGTEIFRVAKPMVEVEALGNFVRESIDGGGDKIPIFQVSAANALFKLIAGPVADRLTSAKALIVDPSGPLETLPISVLVTDDASVRSFAQSRTAAPYDYSHVNFLARQVPISTALSPRSLIVARGLAPSDAPLPFMGFAQHQPVAVSAQFGGRMISIGSGCEVEASSIAALTRQLTPIKADELSRAGHALGLTQVPMLTGAAFSDTAVEARTDLDQFQVLHFATHGLTEGQWGCSKSPPALVTSLGDGSSDAILSFSEIAKLRLNANLVVLSACDTASGVSAGGARAAGQEEAGATLEGLVRAFLAANARAVLSTYWPISNAGESVALIEDFYGAARTGTIGEALKTAQSELIANPKTSHPLYWGAFFVVGDAQKPLLSGGARVAAGGIATGSKGGPIR